MKTSIICATIIANGLATTLEVIGDDNVGMELQYWSDGEKLYFKSTFEARDKAIKDPGFGLHFTQAYNVFSADFEMEKYTQWYNDEILEFPFESSDLWWTDYWPVNKAHDTFEKCWSKGNFAF